MSMLDRLDEPNAESWIPDEGDKLVIKVTSKTVNRGKFGDYVILTGDVQAGSTLKGEAMKLPQQRALHCLGKVLSESVGYESGSEKNPQGHWIDQDLIRVGDLFGCKYHGLIQRDSGPDYHGWKTDHERPTVADRLDAVDEAELFG